MLSVPQAFGHFLKTDQKLKDGATTQKTGTGFSRCLTVVDMPYIHYIYLKGRAMRNTDANKIPEHLCQCIPSSTSGKNSSCMLSR